MSRMFFFISEIILDSVMQLNVIESVENCHNLKHIKQKFTTIPGILSKKFINIFS